MANVIFKETNFIGCTFANAGKGKADNKFTNANLNNGKVGVRE